MKKIITFIKESIDEMKRVEWPTKDDAIRSAVIVVLFVVVFSLFLFFVDMGVQALVEWVVS